MERAATNQKKTIEKKESLEMKLGEFYSLNGDELFGWVGF